ncbi:MAG: UDP-N-acetylmuramate--L-alanine ligase [Patescibacteria group bacterium]|nr:UDP-N-acetylmuramate--L-alanine ligase [Patescibacteria group bacterium]
MNLTKIKKIYMIGIKGVGMTMLAQYLTGQARFRQGYSGQEIEVIGSDIAEKFMTDKVLEKAGIEVIEKFDASNIPQDADLIIYSSAYNAENNIEAAQAISGKIKTLTYAKALGEVFNQKYGIAVVGSHGKTTATAWLGYVMKQAGMEPNVMAGAHVGQFSGCGITGSSDYLVVEADEYQNKLKYLQPKAVLLNNIDYDHPDFFAAKDEYKNVFVKFIKKIPAKGFIVANYDDSMVRKVTTKRNCKIISYAINQNNKADYLAYNIRQRGWKQFFKVKIRGAGSFSEGEETVSRLQKKNLGDFCIQLLGKHNISNALAVIAACVELRIELADIKKYLGEFKGAARRMQVLGAFKGAIIIDDYAHHPTEIKATLAGAREVYKKNKLIIVFHPHTFSRTKVFLNDFAASFGLADEIIVLDIYGSAREKQGGVHSRDLVELIRRQTTPQYRSAQTGQADDPAISLRSNGAGRRQNIKYISTLDECEKYLRDNIGKGDVVILMGAGDVFRIGEKLVGK